MSARQIKIVFVVLTLFGLCSLVYFIAPVFYVRLEHHTNIQIAERVSRWSFLKSTVRDVFLSVQGVTSCVFKGHAECVPFTGEGSVESFVTLSNGLQARLVFNLLGSGLYPATLRTKEIISALETNQAFAAELLFIAADSDPETRSSPQVLGVEAIPAY
jgi:hypothetical protein